MAELPNDPLGVDLEDQVAAHFVSRGIFVETAVIHRDPKDILELDIVWTDYNSDPLVRRAVEIKSGKWQIGDLFKFYGWAKYLQLPSPVFICKKMPGRLGDKDIERLCDRLGLTLMNAPSVEDLSESLASLGFAEPAEAWLPGVWHFSFWAQRRARKVLGLCIEHETCPATAKVAKDYDKLINDAIFFESDPRSRVQLLFSQHLKHPKLALSMANEIGGMGVDFEHPVQCDGFKNSLYRGDHLPIQACMYLGLRGRLAVLKASIDYYFSREAGNLPEEVVKIFDMELDVGDSKLYGGLKSAIDELSRLNSFVHIPVFWQVFLWGWGGFVLTDRLDAEYAALSKETGVSIDEVPSVLGVFDRLFSGASPWLMQPSGDTRKLLKITPCFVRGIGAFSRLKRYGAENYTELGFSDDTARRMEIDHNVVVKLLEATDEELCC